MEWRLGGGGGGGAGVPGASAALQQPQQPQPRRAASAAHAAAADERRRHCCVRRPVASPTELLAAYRTCRAATAACAASLASLSHVQHHRHAASGSPAVTAGRAGPRHHPPPCAASLQHQERATAPEHVAGSASRALSSLRALLKRASEQEAATQATQACGREVNSLLRGESDAPGGGKVQLQDRARAPAAHALACCSCRVRGRGGPGRRSSGGGRSSAIGRARSRVARRLGGLRSGRDAGRGAAARHLHGAVAGSAQGERRPDPLAAAAAILRPQSEPVRQGGHLQPFAERHGVNAGCALRAGGMAAPGGGALPPQRRRVGATHRQALHQPHMPAAQAAAAAARPPRPPAGVRRVAGAARRARRRARRRRRAGRCAPHLKKCCTRLAGQRRGERASPSGPQPAQQSAHVPGQQRCEAMSRGCRDLLERGPHSCPALRRFPPPAGIAACCATGRLDTAGEVLRRASRLGVRVGAGAYHRLIMGYCEQGDMVQAQRVFARLRQQLRAPPDAVAWNTLAWGYARAGDVASARGVVAQAAAAGVQPDAFTWSCLVHVSSGAGGREGWPGAVLGWQAFKENRAACHQAAAQVPAWGALDW